MPKPAQGTDTSHLHNDDAYIAELLAKDARECSLRYSALGVYGSAPKRPTSGAPKPNTRFLKHILRETDTHNANLKRKEEEEARERIRQLRRREVLSKEESRRDNREHGRESKRRRVESPQDKEEDRKRRRAHHSRDYKTATDERSSRPEKDKSRRSRHHDGGSDTEDRKRSHGHRKHREDDKYERHSKHRKRGRSHERSPDRHKVRDKEHRRRRSSERQRRHSVEDTRGAHKKQRNYTKSSDSRLNNDVDQDDTRSAQSTDSDPLSNLIGPLPPSETDAPTPPVLPRGRGAYRVNSSTIDSHFNEGYDPALDVHLDDDDESTTKKSTRRPVSGMATEDDDWDMALEALRDRTAWKRNGAKRLREAGFENAIVEKWENNTAFAGLDDGSVLDVKWAKKGESREWDRGKVVDESGHVHVKPVW
ncbi:hypothetical protein CIHG_02205 [Coccidioides immitis H538.4]|uniref:Pre-mRNA-splicing factor 38B n=1 Tax=Coccidioides immitis H538.4 TaxID=396776 RepID=A0A0J8RGX4_COCIT|nr:hypothetical protein CIHG_02205 [Coccidioides immitis H538.4]